MNGNLMVLHSDVQEFTESRLDWSSDERWSNPLEYYAEHFVDEYPDTDADIGDLVIGLKEITSADVEYNADTASQDEPTIYVYGVTYNSPV